MFPVFSFVCPNNIRWSKTQFDGNLSTKSYEKALVHHAKSSDKGFF